MAAKVRVLTLSFSLLERSWPIAIATGWGFGVAYADAQVSQKKLYLPR